MARLKFPKDKRRTYWEDYEDGDLMRWAKERTNRFGHFSHSPDPETAVFGSIVFAITATILILGFLVSLWLGPWTWLVVGIIGALPVFFSAGFLIALIGDYFRDRFSYKDLLRELRRRELI